MSQTGFGHPTHWLGSLLTPVNPMPTLRMANCAEEKHVLGSFSIPTFSPHSLYLCASYTHRSVIQRIPRVVYKDRFYKYLYYPLIGIFLRRGFVVAETHIKSCKLRTADSLRLSFFIKFHVLEEVKLYRTRCMIRSRSCLCINLWQVFAAQSTYQIYILSPFKLLCAV